jgi:hypothetical protein
MSQKSIKDRENLFKTAVACGVQDRDEQAINNQPRIKIMKKIFLLLAIAALATTGCRTEDKNLNAYESPSQNLPWSNMNNNNNSSATYGVNQTPAGGMNNNR